MNINEKASYIKGLAEGMKFDTTTDTGRLIKEMIGLLEDMALSISDLEDENARLEAYIDELDHDLADVEEEVYGEDDDCCCDDCCDGDDDEDLYEIECPACHDTVYLDGDMIEEGGITCPNCGTELEFDFDCDCDDCCDDCDHEEEKE